MKDLYCSRPALSRSPSRRLDTSATVGPTRRASRHGVAHY
jgi:hypothetical protein